MMKQKGFTLIELLAVIVVLAVVAIIAIPLITNVIDKAKQGALKDSGYGIIESAEMYLAKNMSTGITDTMEFICNNGTCLSGTEEINYKGSIDSGSVLIFSNNKVALCVENEKYNAIKNINDKEIVISKGECVYNEETKEYTVDSEIKYDLNIKNDFSTWLYSASIISKNFENIESLSEYPSLILYLIENESSVKYLSESPDLVAELKKITYYFDIIVPALLKSDNITNKQKFDAGLPCYLYNSGDEFTDLTGGWQSYTTYKDALCYGEMTISINNKGVDNLNLYDNSGSLYMCSGYYINAINLKNYSRIAFRYSHAISVTTQQNFTLILNGLQAWNEITTANNSIKDIDVSSYEMTTIGFSQGSGATRSQTQNINIYSTYIY